MKKLSLLYAFLALLTTHNNFGYAIKAIFFDIEAIFQTDSMRASSYVGKIDSLRYLSQVGHLPSQQDLFNALKPIKATSSQITYNNNLEMPLILSDWLTNAQPREKIQDIIKRYLSNKNISDIEKKVLFAVVSMMLTPQHLADTQKIRSKIETILQALKQQHYKIYLVGNWSHIHSMRQEFPELFTLFSGIFVSGDIHTLKPHAPFYEYILNKTGIAKNNALWVEIEPNFAQNATKLGYLTAQFNPENPKALPGLLQKFNIHINL